MQRKRQTGLALLMWVLPVSFFAFQFILRLWPGLTMQHTMLQYSIDASSFGVLAAFYYYGYAGLQIPVAMLLDRFKVHYVLCFFAVLCGIATAIFTMSNAFYLAVFSRFLIGAGSAVGFLAVSKVVAQWFSPEKYPVMIGYSFTIGLMGAIYGGKPVNALIETFGQYQVSLVLAGVSIFLAVLVLLFLRAPPHIQHSESTPFQWKQFVAIMRHPALWALALANFLMVGSLEGFADVWGIPYLMTAYAVTKSQAAGFTSLIFFGMLFGGPLLTTIARPLGNYRVIILSGVMMAFGFGILLFSKTYHPWLFSSIFFLIGILCCYQVIIFSAGARLVATGSLGVTMAFLNSVNMLGGSFFHTAIGHIMDRHWTGAISDSGVRLYTLAAYHQALAIIPVCALLGVGIMVILRLQDRPSSRVHSV